MSFVAQLDCEASPNPHESLYDRLLGEYERVVVQSLITSFGLDFLIEDQHGGDVDTIHNVREIGRDPNMTYKNKQNVQNYEARGDYNYGEYHADKRFSATKHEARELWQETGKDIKDEYTGKDIGFYGGTKSIPPERKAELDHIIETKSIHEDRARVLSGLSGADLANDPENLVFTNKSLNASMGAWARGVNEKYKKEHGCNAPMDMLDRRAYVAAHPELDDLTKENLLKEYSKARRNYEAKLNRKYYTSTPFLRDTTKQATKLGIKMGLRQAIGLLFSEVWFAVRDVMKSPDTSQSNIFSKIAQALKLAFRRCKERKAEYWTKFIEGSIAGVLSSITTTLCNIFFSTQKGLVRIIRQSWASLVEAVKILLWNPDNLLLGERIRAGAKVIATGASVVAGGMLTNLIQQSPIAQLSLGIGEAVATFCGVLLTGIMSCSLLFLLDHNSGINRIVNVLNKLPTVEGIIHSYQRQCDLLEEYASKLMSIDLEVLKQELASYRRATEKLDTLGSGDEMTNGLYQIYQELEIDLPWEGYSSFDEFMQDSQGRLIFE